MIHEQYIRETYNDQGLLTHAELLIPDDFCFARNVVDAIAHQDPRLRAMVWLNPQGDMHEFTFADMSRYADKTAAWLKSQGIGKGSRVMVILRRHYQFWFVALALSKLGAIMVPATFMLKTHDVRYRFEAAGISAVIATSVGDIADTIDQVCEDLSTEGKAVPLRIIVAAPAVDGEAEGELLSLRADRPGWSEFNEGVQQAAPLCDFPPVSVYDPMLMYFSSGTTGEPKMVLHDGRYALAHLLTAKHWHGAQPGGLHFTIADTGWGKAVWGKLYGQWLMECAVLVYDFDRFHADEILGLIGRFQVTSLCCPPTMYRMMMQTNVDAYDLSSLTHCTTAGEALNPDLFTFWLEHTGHVIYEGFGQTETPLVIANYLHSTPKSGSMGYASPLYRVETLREDGSLCSPGETGEICIALDGGAPGIMMEYFRNPEKTAQAKHDGWYHTGDVAWKDEDGYFWYVGRNDDVIKSSGYRIGPFEIESVLLEHSAVRECAVVGVPDELRGAVVKAYVVLADNVAPGDLLTKELQQWVKQRTAPYKYPRLIEYVDHLPRTTNGKIQRAQLRRR